MLQEGRNHKLWLNIQETLLWVNSLMRRGVSLMQKQGKAASASLPSPFSQRYTGNILKPERTYCSQPTHHRPCDPDRALLRSRVQGGRQWHIPSRPQVCSSFSSGWQGFCSWLHWHRKVVSWILFPWPWWKHLGWRWLSLLSTHGQGHMQTGQKHRQMPGDFGQVYRLAFIWLRSSLVVCLETSCHAVGRPQLWTMLVSQNSW